MRKERAKRCSTCLRPPSYQEGAQGPLEAASFLASAATWSSCQLSELTRVALSEIMEFGDRIGDAVAAFDCSLWRG